MMYQFSVILLLCVFDVTFVCANVHNYYHPRNTVVASFFEPTLKQATLNSGKNMTKKEGEEAATSAARPLNPFGLAGVSENAGKDVKIVDGDIAVPVGQLRSIFKPSQNWPDGIVPFEIDNQYSDDQKNVIMGGMTKIMEATNNCIRFVSKDNNPYWLRIHPGSGCSSYLGKTVDNGAQDLSLQNPDCVHEGTAIHELLHALGHIHEHNRPDRDDWVRINSENISPGMESAFEKYPVDEVETYDFPYDYGSIMHYGSTAFSKNGQRTIDVIKPGFEDQVNTIGTSGALSGWDIEKLKKRYGC